MDIGTEELSHLEVIGSLARMHLKPSKLDREAGEADPLVAIAGGGGVNLFNSQGNPWTADYLKITGELDVDLRSNIAAEARAKIVYERLINFCDDAGTKDALQFLMTREITHMKAFMLALDSLGKHPLTIGEIAADPGPGRSVLQRFHRRGRTRQHRHGRSLERRRGLPARGQPRLLAAGDEDRRRLSARQPSRRLSARRPPRRRTAAGAGRFTSPGCRAAAAAAPSRHCGRR